MKSIFQNKILTVIIILLLAANLSLLIYYSFFKDKRHKRTGPVTEFVKKDVGFTDEQMKVFEETKIKNRAKRKLLFNQVAAAKDSLYQLVIVENLDDSLLFDRALIVADKVRNLELETFRQYKGIQAMCTPDQLKKFDTKFIPMVRRMIWPMEKDGGDSSARK